ncbi:MAG: hypothetical protein ACRDTG_10840 [Pseudonocardiaceae bacterium]
MLVVDDAPLWLQFRVVADEVLFSRDERERIAFREYVEKAFSISGITMTATWRRSGSAPAMEC